MRDWLNYRFENNPSKTFLRAENRTFSYEEVGNIVYDRALALIDFGVKKNHRVGIFLSGPLDFIETYLSCYKIRATSIILNPKWKENELKNIFQEVPLDFIICNFSDKKLFVQFGKPLIFIEELSKSFGSCSPKIIKEKINKNDIQSILFTSGSQGYPKPVCLTYNNFYQSSLKWEKAIDLQSQDEYLLCLPLYHISGLAVIMRALHIGFSISLNMNIKNNFILFDKSSVISVVPTLLIDLMQDSKILECLKNMRCIIVSGSAISKKILSDCKIAKLNMFISYGMTETCSSICGFWLLKNNNSEKSVGYPFEGVNISTENKNIIIQSNTVMKKYFNGLPTNGVFKTLDYGDFGEDLLLYGRVDDTVISGGENIDPSEVISAIKKIIPSCEIEQFKKEDSYWGEINRVYIHTKQEITPEQLRLELKKIISNYKIPHEIFIKKPTS